MATTQTPRIDALLNRLRSERVRKGLSIAKVAKQAGMHANSFLTFDKGKRFNPTADTIRRLERVLLRSNGRGRPKKKRAH